MIEPNTKLYIDNVKNIDEDLDYEMYKYIENMLISSGFTHYEVSNYAIEGFESKHNLVYWNNEYYYGFGLGASGYLEGYRYDNTRSLNSYLEGHYITNVTKINDNDKLKYELMLGFRKIKGINKEEFHNKYNMNLKDMLNIRKYLTKVS
jgi:oxygen-independent coproporphyrinogen-3 oxidase